MRKLKTTTPVLPLLGLFVLSLGQAALAADVRQVDIVGIKLGASPEEAERLLSAYDKSMKIERKCTTYEYSDGKQPFQTPQVFSGIWAEKSVYDKVTMSMEQESIYLNFSADPKNPVVISVAREISGLAKPTTKAEYEGAVVAKYGKPTRVEKADYMVWRLNGDKYRCSSYGSQAAIKGQPIQLLNSIGSGWDPARDCEALLVIRVANDTASMISASLYDPALIVSARKRLGDWIAKFEADAKAKLTKGATAPKL